MPSLLEVEAAIYAYHDALGEQLDPGGGDFAMRSQAMYAALKAAELVRAEHSRLARER